MGVETIEISPTSAAEELGLQALADIAEATKGIDNRIIGGQMVTLHTYRLNLDLRRETRDADLGMTPGVVARIDLASRFRSLGYDKTKGNRFEKVYDSGAGPFAAVIDVLIPSYTSRFRHSRPVGDLNIDEAPGLAEAFKRPSIDLNLKVNSPARPIPLEFTVRLPDEIASLVLKTMARTVRHVDTDAVDIWRCLEICNAARITNAADQLEGETIDQVTMLLETEFTGQGRGLTDLGRALNLNDAALKAKSTRLAALLKKVL